MTYMRFVCFCVDNWTGRILTGPLRFRGPSVNKVWRFYTGREIDVNCKTDIEGIIFKKFLHVVKFQRPTGLNIYFLEDMERFCCVF